MTLTNRLFRQLYNAAINLNQWYTYGDYWVKLLKATLTAAASFGVISIYFSLPQTLENMLAFVIVFICGTVLLGLAFFWRGGEQKDKINLMWRNPLPVFKDLVIDLADIQLYKKFGITTHPDLKEYGVKDLDDLEKMCLYLIAESKKGYFDRLIKKFFGAGKKDEN